MTIKAQKKQNQAKTMTTKSCIVCGDPVPDKRYMYCSEECKDVKHREIAKRKKEDAERKRLKKKKQRDNEKKMESFDPRQGAMFDIYTDDDPRKDEAWVFEGDPREAMLPPASENGKSLWKAQGELLDGVNEGTHCPCCGRWAKVYKRGINRNMALGLMWIVRNSDRHINYGWIDMPKRAPKWMLRSNQFATLRWWGLIERRGNAEYVEDGEGGGDIQKVDKTKKHLGLWRPTRKGIKFANSQIQAPKHVITLFGEPIGFGEDLVMIKECLGEGFSYEDAMKEASLKGARDA